MVFPLLLLCSEITVVTYCTVVLDLFYSRKFEELSTTMRNLKCKSRFVYHLLDMETLTVGRPYLTTSSLTLSYGRRGMLGTYSIVATSSISRKPKWQMYLTINARKDLHCKICKITLATSKLQCGSEGLCLFKRWKDRWTQLEN